MQSYHIIITSAPYNGLKMTVKLFSGNYSSELWWLLLSISLPPFHTCQLEGRLTLKIDFYVIIIFFYVIIIAFISHSRFIIRCEKLFSWHIFLLSLCISRPALHCMCFAQRAWKLPHLMTTSHVPRDATLRTNRLTLHLCAAISTEDAAWSEQHISLQMSVFFPLLYWRLLYINAAGHKWLFVRS